MNRKITDASIIVGTTIVIIFLVPILVTLFRTATVEYQNLYNAIGAGLIGIFLHFFKKYPKVERKYMLEIESLELLMLIISPTFVSFEILLDVFPKNPYPILIVSLLAMGSWYVFTLIENSKPENVVEGKRAFLSAIILFGSITFFIISIIVVIMFFKL